MNGLTVVTSAEAWLGYVAPPNGRTVFGERTGYDGNIWSGSFIDFIFKEAGVTIPSCVYSPSGLAEFFKMGRVKTRPQPGDIVFFTFATGEIFGTPHVGLVADTSRYRTDGLVGTIEANVNSGLPKSDTSVRGVFRRVRSKHEIIGFARPTYRPGAKKASTGQRALVQLEHIRPGRRNISVGLVQLALNKVTGSLGKITPDLFDGSTQHAYARWQRINGYVGERANGVPDEASLRLLGETTGIFELRGIPAS